MHLNHFTERGYLDPVRILTPRQCVHFMRAALQPHTPPPLDWHKGHAASARPFYEVATHPGIVDLVTTLLGEDVMLWGAQLVTRGPGAVHPWHSDIEPSHAPEGKTVTVWLGIENTTADSALTVVPYSHRFHTLQEVASQRRAAGQDATATTEHVAQWALEREQRATLVMPPVTDGVALFFEGHLWHHSNNVSGLTRRALLLQYATPDVAIRIPDLNYVNYPFRHMNVPRPGCLMVSGSDNAGVNRIVAAPVSVTPGLPARLGSRVYPIDVPLAPKTGKPWTPYPIFKGATAGVRAWSCHASVLLPNHSPHPPHRHDEEEILMVLDGEVDLELPESGWAAGDARLRLKPGQFVFYPPHFPHTLRATDEKPASYLMFKWRDGAAARDSPLPFGRFDAAAPGSDGEARHAWGVRQKFFAAPTANLGTLKCHVSTMAPGASYEPHADAYDVAIVTLDGDLETLGERVPPRSVVFYPAGELHGMRNVNGAPARYVVFEFHSGRTAPDLARYARPSLLRRLTDPKRWRRQIEHMLSR